MRQKVLLESTTFQRSKKKFTLRKGHTAKTKSILKKNLKKASQPSDQVTPTKEEEDNDIAFLEIPGDPYRLRFGRLYKFRVKN